MFRKGTSRYKYQAGGKWLSVLFIQQTVQLSEGRPWKVPDLLKRNIAGTVIKVSNTAALQNYTEVFNTCRRFLILPTRDFT